MIAPGISRRPRFLTGPRIVGFVAALAVGALVVWQLRSEEYASVASWRERLATVAAERTRLIDNWVREREMDARSLATLPLARELVGEADPGARGGHRLRLLRRHIDHFCGTYAYADVALVDSEGRLLASCSGGSPSAETARWALAAAGESKPRAEIIELGAEGFALRFASPVLSEPSGDARARPSGAIVLTTKPLVSLDHIVLPTIGGTRSGRIELHAVAPEDRGRFLQAAVPVLGGGRVLVAKVRRSEALAPARAAAVSQGLVAVVAILLPLLIATIGWQRDRTRALREALGQQRSLLEARAYAESIVQSVDAVVWEAEAREDVGGQEAGAVPDAWRFSFVSKPVESLLGRSTEAWIGHENLWLDCIEPNDRPRVARFYAEVTARPSNEGSIEFCAKRPDGTEVWLRDRVIAVSGQSGVRRLRGVLFDVTDRVRAELDATALLAVARDVTSSRDRREIFGRVQRRTAELLPCDRVVTFLNDSERGVFRVAAHHGVLPERVAAVEALELRAGQALGGRVLAGDTVVLNHVREQPWLPVSLYESFGVNALVATPLLLGGRPAGALVAFAVEPNRAPFEARQATLLEGIARQLAVGLEVSRYHEEQAEEAIVSGALARVSRELIASPAEPEALLVELCRLTVEILGCDVSHTILQGPGEDTLALVASAGASPEELASLAAMRLPGDVAAPFLGELLSSIMRARCRRSRSTR